MGNRVGNNISLPGGYVSYTCLKMDEHGTQFMAILMEKMMIDHWILIFLAMMNPVWPTKYLIFVHISCGYEDAEMIRWWFWEMTSDLGQMLWTIACKSLGPDQKMPPEWPSDFSPPWQAARRLQCWSAEGGRVGVRSQWSQIQPCSFRSHASPVNP